MADSRGSCQSFPCGFSKSFKESEQSLTDDGDLSRKGIPGDKIFGRFNEIGGSWKVGNCFCRIEKDSVAWRKNFHMQLLKRPTCLANITRYLETAKATEAYYTQGYLARWYKYLHAFCRL